jgi:hypothetical protein
MSGPFNQLNVTRISDAHWRVTFNPSRPCAVESEAVVRSTILLQSCTRNSQRRRDTRIVSTIQLA